MPNITYKSCYSGTPIPGPRYNDPRYNDLPGITINMLYPGKSYSKMYGTEPRYNDLRYNDIPDITMSF